MSLKNCLIVLRNKKVNDFDVANSLIKKFASQGVYFDRVEYCAFDDSEEITRSVRECKGNYSGIVILCPQATVNALKAFSEKLFGGKFEGVALSAEGTGVFVINSDDAEGRKSAAELVISKLGRHIGRMYIKTVGASTAVINEAIGKVKNISPQCDFNVTSRYSDCSIEIIYPQTLGQDAVDVIYRSLIGSLNEYVYAIEDVSLAERLYQLLKLRRIKISVAESFTGGGIAKRLVEVPGVSEVYYEGVNTYSNESKTKRLGVKQVTLKNQGAVSEDTAYEMVEGLLNTGGCDVAVSTTGIAGPNSDSTSKPVGLIYIGVGKSDGISVTKYELKGDRQTITETAINLALFAAFKKIK